MQPRHVLGVVGSLTVLDAAWCALQQFVSERKQYEDWDIFGTRPIFPTDEPLQVLGSKGQSSRSRCVRDFLHFLASTMQYLENHWTEFYQTFRIEAFLDSGEMFEVKRSKVKVTAWPSAQQVEVYRTRHCALSCNIELYLPCVGFRAQVCYHCRISPPRFLAECRKRRLNQGSFVLLFFTLSDLYLVFACLFSCTALFVSISQVIGCEDRLRNDPYFVGWGVKLCSTSTSSYIFLDDPIPSQLPHLRRPLCLVRLNKDIRVKLAAKQTNTKYYCGRSEHWMCSEALVQQ